MKMRTVKLSEHFSEGELEILKGMEEGLKTLFWPVEREGMSKEEVKMRLEIVTSFVVSLLQASLRITVTRAGMLMDEDKLLLAAHDMVNGLRDELLVDLQGAITSWCSVRAKVVAGAEAKAQGSAP